MGLLAGKKAVIFGVANDKSIAWAIAKKFEQEGADIALTYAGDTLIKRVIPLAKSIDASLVLPCNVQNDANIKKVFSKIEKTWGGLDILIHSVAFANKDELKGSFLTTSREGFAKSMDISAYSLIGLVKEAMPLMEGRQSSVLTLSYYGGQKVFPNYNIMGVAKAALESSVCYLAEATGSKGVRVNAISAGPLKTLSATGVGGFNHIAKHVAGKAPLRRNVTLDEVANSALYLCSPLASGVTGEIHFVDCGYNIIGL